MFKIDKGIPIEKAQRQHRSKYPFHAMTQGDSFFTPIKPVTTKQRMGQLKSAAFQCSTHHPEWKFAFRQVNEGGIDGIRIWRTK